MLIEELNLGRVFQIGTARYKKLRWPVTVLFVASRAAANRAPLDESGTKVGRCHTVHSKTNGL